ncbi:MAG: hypothetical protein WCK49_06195 [Myxococcaceae bacterium]
MVASIRTRMKQGGRLVIPVEYRRELHLNLDQEVLLSLEDGVLHVVPLNFAVARAQALVKKYNPEHRSLSDELIALRREENEDV